MNPLPTGNEVTVDGRARYDVRLPAIDKEHAHGHRGL